MNCNTCGQVNLVGSKFCSECGSLLKQVPQRASVSAAEAALGSLSASEAVYGVGSASEQVYGSSYDSSASRSEGYQAEDYLTTADSSYPSSSAASSSGAYSSVAESNYPSSSSMSESISESCFDSLEVSETPFVESEAPEVSSDEHVAAKTQFDLFVNHNVAGYHMEKKLGEGPRGAVFLATHLELKETVAIRVLPPDVSSDRAVVDRLVRESQSLARLNSPYLLPVFKMFRAAGHFCIAMRYTEGGSVRDLLRREGRLDERKSASIIHQAALGLGAAAEEAVVHPDLRPENLLVTAKTRIKISGFSLAPKLEVSTALTTRVIEGSPLYMAPEQCQQEPTVDHRSNLYSLGCILYELLTGEPPFTDTSNANLMVKHLLEQAPDVQFKRPDVSPEMADVVSRLLHKDPAARFQTGEDVAAALAPLTGEHLDDGGASGTRPAFIAISQPAPQPLRSLPELPKSARHRRSARSASQPKSNAIFIGVAVVAVFLLGVFVASKLGGPVADPEVQTEPGKVKIVFYDLLPLDEDTVPTTAVTVKGKALPENPKNEGVVKQIIINQQLVDLGPDGSFSRVVELTKGKNYIELRGGASVQMLTVYSEGHEPPTITFVEPANGAIVTTDKPRVVIRVPGKVIEVKIGGVKADPTGPELYAATVTLTPGEQTILARVVDGYSQVWSGKATLNFDPTRSELFFVKPENESWSKSREVDVEVRVQGGNVQYVEINQVRASLTESGNYVARIELDEGRQRVIEAITVDDQGRTASKRAIVNVDRTKPTIRHIFPTDGVLVGPKDKLFQVEVPGEDIYEVRFNEQVAFLKDGVWEAEVRLNEGEGRGLKVTAEDWAGNVAESMIAVDADYTAPDLRPSVPNLTGAIAKVNIAADEPIRRYRIGEGSEVEINQSSVYLEVPLAEGQETIVFTAWDAAGNERTANIPISLKVKATAHEEIMRRVRNDLQQGHYARAAQDLRAALTLLPDMTEARYAMAVAGAQSGDLDSCYECVEYLLRKEAIQAPRLLNDPLLRPAHGTARWNQILQAYAPEKAMPHLTDIAPDWEVPAAQKAWAESLKVGIATSNSIGMELVLVGWGAFKMGSRSSEKPRRDDETRHDVTLTYPLYFGRTEVSQAHWKAVMGAAPNPSHFTDSEDLPIESLPWLDAIKFCNELSKKEGLQLSYVVAGDKVTLLGLDSKGYRLPTEAEWEFACRADKTSPFNTGHDITTEQANFDGREREVPNGKRGDFTGRTVAIDAFKPNDWGLKNMHGNVREWVWDFYGDYPSTDTKNPTGPNEGAVHMTRGGSWFDYDSGCRSARRMQPDPTDKGYTGFRVVRPIVVQR